MKRFIFGNIFLVVCMAVMIACKPSLPSDVLSKGKMADILYDYHLALSMAHTADGGDKGQSVAYREAVLKKHDVTSAEFDSSMVYYMRHTELMQDVYKDIADRLSKETVALGGNGSVGGSFDHLSATGDTANVWTLATSMVFTPQKPFNEQSFKIEADTAYHKGDCLMLDFEAQFIYQDGIRDGIALLSVEFANDSVTQSIVHISSSQHYSVQITDNDNLGIKSVKGYFILANGGFNSGDASATTLKLMFIDHIKLIRMHAQKVEESKNTVSADSTRVDSAKVGANVTSTAGTPLRMANEKQLKPMDKPLEMKSR